MMTCAVPGAFGGGRLPDSAVTASAEETEAPTSGTCGDSLSWEFDEETGTLTVSGTGSMYDFEPFEVPWFTHLADIKKVELPDGLTNTGSYAFSDCKHLTEISLPDSVTSVNSCAFTSSPISTVRLSEQLSEIGAFAFNETSLREISFPASLQHIGKGALLL